MTALSSSAAEGRGRKPLSPEQQQTRDTIIQKYDANKDGVLDKAELKQISKRDKKALAKTGGVGTAKKVAKLKEDTENEKLKEQKKVQKKAGEEAPAETAGKTKEPKVKSKGRR